MCKVVFYAYIHVFHVAALKKVAEGGGEAAMEAT
jgi:hypothetical protein